MPKYKIGEVARMLSLSNDMLRYYESRGIVTPQKDEQSGYRYYDAWDLNFILDSKWYRSFDFSLSDVEQMINKDNLEALIMRCHQKEEEMLHIIYTYQQKLCALAEFRRRADCVKGELGSFEVVTSPAFVYQKLRFMSEFDCSDETAPLLKQWTDLMPLINHTFLIPLTLTSKEHGFDEYWWGYSLTPEEAIRHHIKITPPVEYIPPRKSIRSVFSAGGRNTFMTSLKSQVMDTLQDKGYVISHSPVGNLIARVHENDEFTRYFEIWVPIEQ